MISGNCLRFCKGDISKIENYLEAINSDLLYDCHHRLEISPCGNKVSAKWLKEHNLYYNRPAEELIFIEHGEHSRMHMKGRDSTEKQRQNCSYAQKFSKRFEGHKHSEESKSKISNSLLNKYKERDKDRFYCAPKIYGDREYRISLTLRSKRSIYVEFDEETPWGKVLTTRQIAELNGNKQSGVVKQSINKYGYINIRHTRYYCHIIS